MILCALCLRDPSSGPILPVRANPELTEAVTIANGNALCRTHFERLSDWQTADGGPLSVEALLRVMHDPGELPARPWLTADA